MVSWIETDRINYFFLAKKSALDVDDILGARLITVSGSEIKAARIQVEVSNVIQSAAFQENGIALAEIPFCA